MREKFFDKFIIILIALLILFAIFLQISTVESTNKLKNEELKIAEQYASKIAQLIQVKTDYKIEETLNKNPTLREEINETLYAFLTKQYQYIFVLKKDENDKYHFLLDASKEDREEYHTPFFPKNKLFLDVCKSGKMRLIEQSDGVEEVWMSLLYPIQIKGKTQALLVLDLSKEYGKYLTNFHSPLMNILTMMQVFLVISFLSLSFFAYRYYKARRELRYDKLTSLYSKYYLTEYFNKYSVDNYHVMLIDIDEFKDINQKFGNAFGDRAIQLFTQTVVEHLCDASKVIRIGGTEFLVLIPKNKGELDDLASGLFNTLQSKKYAIGNDEIGLRVSMSAISVPEGTGDIRSIQRLLDEKLLDIKSKGKNALGIIGKKHIDDIKYSNIDYIKDALEAKRLTCLYQPIYDTKTKKIVKYEALVRLIDKDDAKKLISPFYFMDIIKGTSQYIKMSKLVLNEVFTTLLKYPNIELSMNLDLDDLDNKDMMELISKKLSKHREIASRLTFEILEEHEIKDYEKVQKIFEKLKEYGSKIALDDFGSGYASYSYLIKLDIDILKIDGSLVSELQHNPLRAKEILKSIQRLAVKFEYELVAEFVSHEDIYEMINELNIMHSQGYYLGEPRPINEYLT
jgi:diguanylate cyclase (GGDEF)-like protein